VVKGIVWSMVGGWTCGQGYCLVNVRSLSGGKGMW
jgi:hypothetical protein